LPSFLTTRRDQLLGRRETLLRLAGSAPLKAPAKRVVRRYVADLHDTLRRGTIAEQKAFMRSFVKRINIDDPAVKLNYTIPLALPDGWYTAERRSSGYGKDWLPGSNPLRNVLSFPGTPRWAKWELLC
jgi:hypothetical protein